MTANRGFSLRFDQMRESDPGKPDKQGSEEQADAKQTYGGSGHVRNLCFAWLDGRKLFLNYAYLVSGEFATDGETNTIKLAFTSHLVTLNGYGLDELYLDLLEQIPRIIEEEDARYRDTSESKFTVTEIVVSTAAM